MDQSGAPQNRKSRRAPVLLTANVIVGGIAHVVRLRNLSEEGALVEAEDFPPEGIDGQFERNELSVRCTVIWVEGRIAGIKFARPLKAEEVLRQVPKPQPPKQLEFKRSGLACRPISDYERKMLERWMMDARAN